MFDNEYNELASNNDFEYEPTEEEIKLIEKEYDIED